MSEAATHLAQVPPTGRLFQERKELGTRPPPKLESMRSTIPDRWARHPGRGLTVSRIISIFAQAERGYPAVMCDLVDDVVKRDGHVLSAWLRRVAAVAGKPWIIQAGGERPADIRAAELLADRIRRVPNVRRFMRHLVKHKYYGWSATEVLWDVVDGVFAPVWFENVRHRRIVFDDLCRPRLVVGSASSALSETIPLEPGRWVYIAADEGPPALAGIALAVVLWAHYKSLALRDWILTNERFFMPIPIGTYTDATPTEEKAVLADAVSKIGTDFAAVFHESCKIASLAIAAGATPEQAQGAFIALCEAQLSKLFSGATLTSGEGSSTGSYALGDVHANSEYTFTSDDEQEVGDAFEAQVGVPFVQWNGMDAKPPRLKVHVVKESNPPMRMDIFSRALDMGLAIDVDQVRQEFSLRKPTGETLKKSAPAPSPFGAPPAVTEPPAEAEAE